MSQQNDRSRYGTKGDARLDRELDTLGDLPRNLPFPADDLKGNRQPAPSSPPKSMDKRLQKALSEVAAVFERGDAEFDSFQTELDRLLAVDDMAGVRQHLAVFPSIAARHQALIDAIYQGLKPVR